MVNDLRYALRALRHSPGFAASAILALALGIGANTAVFSVVYAVLLRPLPYPKPDELVRLSERSVTPGFDNGMVSRGTFADWRARTRTLATLAAYTHPGESLWTLGDRIEPVKTAAVSPAIFPMLGASPIIGRAFSPAPEPGTTPADTPPCVISYTFWQRAFGGDSSVVGRVVQVEGRFSRQIIGVMPVGFGFPDDVDAWTSLNVDGPVPPERRRTLSYRAIARLAPHATITAARSEFANLSNQLSIEQPASNAGWSAQVDRLAGADAGAAKPALLALVGAVAGVLLIACANVANLLLARATARRRDMAVRMALGAGAARLVRQSLIEAGTLSVFGAAAGLLLGYWLAGVLAGLAPPDIPRLGGVAMDLAVLLFAAGAGLACTIVVGVAPAWQVARADRHGGLRPDARSVTARGAAVRRALVASEVGVVVLLLTGALLLVRTFVNLRGVDLGFQPEHVVNVETRWPLGRLFPSTPGVRPWPRVQRAVDGLIATITSVPGVEAAGLISDVPLTGDPYSGTVWRADAPGASGLTPPADPRDRWQADLSVVTAGYFRAMNIPVLRGRNFIEGDRLTDEQLNARTVPQSGVVVVNSTFASRYFAGEDPVGRTLILNDDQTFGWSRTIVGVVGDVRGRRVAEAPRPAVFLPHGQHPDVTRPSVAVRSSLPVEALATTIRQRIAEYDPQLLVQRIRPMDDVVSGALSRPRFNLVLLCSFAIVALALAAVGIYGVVAFLVTERTREIGIRMALGARAADVWGLMLREGMAPVAVGGAVGMVVSLAATRAVRSMLFGVTPLDPISFAVAPVLLAAVALVACHLPARRATRIDPLVALREE